MSRPELPPLSDDDVVAFRAMVEEDARRQRLKARRRQRRAEELQQTTDWVAFLDKPITGIESLPFSRLLVQRPTLRDGKVVYTGDWREFGSRLTRYPPFGLLPLENDLPGCWPIPPTADPADIKLWFDFLLGGGYPGWDRGVLEFIDYSMLCSVRNSDEVYIGQYLRRVGVVPELPPLTRQDYRPVVLAGLHFALLACGDRSPVEPVDVPQPCGPAESRLRLQRLRCSVAAIVAADQKLPPTDPFADLRPLIAALRLKKNERVIVEALCDAAGVLPLAVLSKALPHPWTDLTDNWNSARRRLNDKLEGHGFTLVTRDGRAAVERIATPNGRT